MDKGTPANPAALDPSYGDLLGDGLGLGEGVGVGLVPGQGLAAGVGVGVGLAEGEGVALFFGDGDGLFAGVGLGEGEGVAHAIGLTVTGTLGMASACGPVLAKYRATGTTIMPTMTATMNVTAPHSRRIKAQLTSREF